MPIRLSDIAKMANVSIATASYVLNGKGEARGISEATAERIKKIAKTHGFVLNRTAGFLQKGRYHLIAVIAPRCADFLLELLQEIQQEGEKQDYQIIYSSTFDSIDREKTYLKSLIARRVDGVVILPVDIHAQHLRYLHRNHVPTVFFRRRADSTAPHKFMAFADVEGGYMAARHLIEQGCRRIVFSSGPIFLEWEYFRIIHEARLEGCLKALREAGLPLHGGEAVIVDERDPRHHEILAAELRRSKADGIVGFSDYHCMMLMDALRRTGFRLPEDMRIIGFDDTNFNKFMAPPLSSIGFPKAELGRTMVESLMRMIETKEQETDEILLTPHLAARESSLGAAPPRIESRTRRAPSVKRKSKTPREILA